MIATDLLIIVNKMLSDTEEQLSSLLGSKVSLVINLAGSKLNSSEAQEIRLQRIVCEEFNLSWHKLVAKNRSRNLVNARAAYYFMARGALHQKVTKIAKLFNRNHGTIIYSIRQTEKFISINDPIAQHILNIEKEFYEDRIEA